MEARIKILLVLLVSALVPLSTAAWAISVNATDTGTGDNQTSVILTSNSTLDPVNVTNETITNISVRAYNLLIILDKVANYTGELILRFNSSNVTIPEYVSSLYSKAEIARIQAWRLYNDGNYSESIRASKSALYIYKEIIEKFAEYYEMHEEELSREEYYEIVMDAKEELHRATEYFPYVEKVIMEARAEGLNVTYVMELYNMTKAAYMAVARDLANNNITALIADLEYAEELMDKLEDAVEALSEDIVSAKADEISRAFVEKLREQMKLIEKLMAVIGNSTVNSTYLQEDFLELQIMYEQFNALVENGQYEEALEMLHDINEELVDIIDEIQEEYIEEYKEMYEGDEDGYTYIEEYEESDEEYTYTEEYIETEDGYCYRETYEEDGEQYHYEECYSEEDDSYEESYYEHENGDVSEETEGPEEDEYEEQEEWDDEDDE